MRRQPDGAPRLGRERRLLTARRWWASTMAVPVLRWALLLAVTLVPLVAALFTWVAVVDGGWMALRLLTGDGRPEVSDAPFAAAALLVLGWLLVPASVGALVGVLVDRGVGRLRGQPVDRVDRRIREDLARSPARDPMGERHGRRAGRADARARKDLLGDDPDGTDEADPRLDGGAGA